MRAEAKLNMVSFMLNDNSSKGEGEKRSGGQEDGSRNVWRGEQGREEGKKESSLEGGG